jgi:hypothetical protein
MSIAAGLGGTPRRGPSTPSLRDKEKRMRTTMTLAIVLCLAAGRAGDLTLANVRTTYGVLGPTRPDNKILPGDALAISFDIDGVKPTAGNKALYKIGMEVTDSSGKLLFRQEPRDQEAPWPAASKILAACATLQVGTGQPPGEYTVKVTVADRNSGATGDFSRTYTLLPRGFGIVRVSTTGDAEGRSPLPVLQTGKSAWINFSTVGQARKEEHGQPDVAVAMQVRDQEGRPLLTNAPSGEVKKGVPDSAAALPFQFELELNRPGTFTVELTATDKIGGGNASVAFPVTVVKAK